MACDVHFVGGGKLTVTESAETVAAALRDAAFGRFEQPGKRPAVWINPANVAYVAEPSGNPTAVGFH